MTDLRKAAEQALEAMAGLERVLRTERVYPYVVADVAGASDALRAALAEPEPEPVAWMVYTIDGRSVCITDNPSDFTKNHRVLPLYTAAHEFDSAEDPAEVAAKYNALLMAGEKKYPGETRHETALYYITQAEQRNETEVTYDANPKT